MLATNGINKYQKKLNKRDKFAIAFANWLEKLAPAQRVSFWSKSGESKGLFTMDNEQLLESFKKSLTKHNQI